MRASTPTASRHVACLEVDGGIRGNTARHMGEVQTGFIRTCACAPVGHISPAQSRLQPLAVCEHLRSDGSDAERSVCAIYDWLWGLKYGGLCGTTGPVRAALRLHMIYAKTAQHTLMARYSRRILSCMTSVLRVASRTRPAHISATGKAVQTGMQVCCACKEASPSDDGCGVQPHPSAGRSTIKTSSWSPLASHPWPDSSPAASARSCSCRVAFPIGSCCAGTSVSLSASANAVCSSIGANVGNRDGRNSPT